jgi:hypothetical protein
VISIVATKVGTRGSFVVKDGEKNWRKKRDLLSSLASVARESFFSYKNFWCLGSLLVSTVSLEILKKFVRGGRLRTRRKRHRRTSAIHGRSDAFQSATAAAVVVIKFELNVRVVPQDGMQRDSGPRRHVRTKKVLHEATPLLESNPFDAQRNHGSKNFFAIELADNTRVILNLTI